MKWILTRVVLPAVLAAAGLAAAVMLFVLSPSAERAEVAPRVAIVDIVEIQPRDTEAVVVATGTTVAAQQITLVPEVSGKLSWVSDALAPGGRVAKGDVLAKVDRGPYALAARQQASQVAMAELELALEQGRSKLAEREWGLLGKEGEPTNLALRKPHLAAASASLDAAQSALSRAQLDLGRTALKAPFNAMVVEENVDVGQVVGPSTSVARLVGTDSLWVRVSVPLEQLSVLDIPGAGAETGSLAQVHQRLGSGARLTREGRVRSLGGELDPQTRTATLIVEIDDPFGDGTELPLLPGAYVDVEMVGRTVPGAMVIPRIAVSEGDRVWVVAEGDTLEPRTVEIAWSADDVLYVSEGLAAGDRLVTTPLSLPMAGMPVQRRDQTASTDP